MFKHVVAARYIENYKIWLSFNDGKEGEVNLAGDRPDYCVCSR